MKPAKKFSVILTTILCIALLLPTSCKKEKEEDPGPAPQLPPSSSFIMNFSDFDSANDTVNKGKAADTAGTYKNWGAAFINVAVWNLVLTVGLVVPVASFAESFKHAAVYDKNEKKWVWSYSFTAGVVHTAKLKANVSGNDVHWAMYISKAGSFQDFLWYSGDSKLNGTEGTWKLYDNPASNKELFGIVWHNNTSNGTSDIKYTNIVPSGPDNGAYIAFGIIADANYNAFYDIYNKGQNNTVNIKWHTNGKKGKIKDPAYFKDSDYHCWDAILKNSSSCP